jgi:hypothetical protein
MQVYRPGWLLASLAVLCAVVATNVQAMEADGPPEGREHR